MTQVSIGHLRSITVYLWNCGIPACDHKQVEFRLLNYCGLDALRTSVLVRLQGLTTEQVLELRDAAATWIGLQSPERRVVLFDQFDEEHNLANYHAPARINWRAERESAA